MDKAETAELPGNDASWYRALLEEDGTNNGAVDAGILDPPPSGLPTFTPPPTMVTVEPHNEQADTGDVDLAGIEDSDEPDPNDGIGATLAGTAAAVTPPDQPTTEIASPLTDNDNDNDNGESAAAGTLVPDPTTDPDLTPGERELSPGESASEMVGHLWTSSAQDGPIDGWAPDDMDRAISSQRSFRWTPVIAFTAVIVLVVVGLVLLPTITRSRANNHRNMMTAALDALRGELPDTQTSLEIATEPDSTTTDLGDLSTQLTALSAKASAVDGAGRASLPSTPPLTSSQPIDELAPVQKRLEPLATTALTIQQRIANLVEYRMLMTNFLVLPDLPTEADAPTQSDLRVAMASAQAQSASILADLPEDVSLSEHAALARQINESFATWQVDYLEALRTQDAVRAEMLIADLTAQLNELEAQLVTPLAQIRRQADADLIDLARSIDDVVGLALGQVPAP